MTMELGIAQALFIGLWLVVILKFLLRDRKLDHIPCLGFSIPILSTFSGIKFLWAGRQIIEEGYRKYPNQVWRVPMIDEWLVVANGPKNVDDIRRASEDVLSGTRSNAVFYQWEYTIGPEVTQNPYHINVVRGPLTRNLADKYDDLHEEMNLACNDLLPREPDWISIPIFETLVEIISRMSSRIFVGLPLCHNAEYRALCIQGVMELVKGRLLHLFPEVLRPYLGKKISNVDGIVSGLEVHLKETFEYRMSQERLYGSDWPDRPNDIFTWTIDAARANNESLTLRNIAKRMVLYAFASTHTTAVAFLQTILELNSRPEYIQPLRDEVEAVISSEGWSKASVAKLYKMDSFMRETQRYHGLGLVLLTRRVLKDFTFSDGTVVPAGSALCVNSWGLHHDETIYLSPNSFDGFRFAREDGKDQPIMAAPTLEYTAFGHGRPACPGRFFAVSEMKTILAHILLDYDMKLEKPVQTKMMWLETKVVPDVNIKVMFRKRVD